MPKNIQTKVLKKGECLWRSCNNLLALRWKDKRDVYMISTKHKSVEMVEYIDKQFKKTMKPKCILEYNKGTGGIESPRSNVGLFPNYEKSHQRITKTFFLFVGYSIVQYVHYA